MANKIEIEKLNYILNQFNRTKHKKYEHYCISRIYHLLNRTDIQFITQQMLKRKEEKIALADLYLPQLDVWVEVDEFHHNNHINKKEDEERTKEVIEKNKEIERKQKQLEEVISVKNEPYRIQIEGMGPDEVDKQIDKIVEIIKNKINEKEKNYLLQKWELIHKEPKFFKDKGVLKTEDKPAFRTIQKVSELFNKGYNGKQQCWFRDKPKSKITIWCPKLKFETSDKGKYDNFIDPNSETIYEFNPNQSIETNVQGTRNLYSEGFTKRYVFPKFKDFSGKSMYRFKGVYELNLEKTEELGKVVWEKIGDEIDLTEYSQQ
ncbi:MAG: AbaSI family restriction endonuclease [Candidatus Nanoarchaeia archaeon]